MRRLAPPTGWLGLCLVAVALGGCFTTTADFQQEAEDFIVQDQDIATVLETAFVSSTCTTPETRDVDEEFTCEAIDEMDRTWEFLATITGENSFRVEVVEASRPDG